MSVAHAASGLVYIQSLMFQIAELEPVHDIIICLFGIKVTPPRQIGKERSDAVGKTLLYKVVAKVHVIFRAYCYCYVNWSCPVALGNHFEHHQITLSKNALSFQRYNHLVRNGI